MMIEKNDDFKNDTLKRVQITLRPQVLEDLDRLADEWGTSRSGMITLLTRLRVDFERSELMADMYKND